ncbi:MAG: hypothetical protein P4L67_00085 [Candidatus Pacebacteria bacterium]|nr:hypothetical protein [Candidatus Paceibacterota bacterium]
MSIAGLRCSTAKSTMSRDRADKPQARDKVKDLLVNKLMKKFGRMPNASTVIPARVTRFMQQNRLTDANLKKLEKEILQALTAKPSVQQAPPAPKPEVRPSSKDSRKSDAVIIKSMRKEENPDIEKQIELEQLEEREQIPYNDDKDWDAILKFNKELYQEELKQEEEKKMQQKRFIRSELDKQLDEKRRIGSKAAEEHHCYQNLESAHLKTLEQKEKDKEEQMKMRKQAEKDRLDRQFKDELMRKRMTDLENKQYEHTLVERNRRELEEERLAQAQKKEMERTYHKKMMEENEMNKRKQLDSENELREQEKKDLVEYTKVLDQQESDRLEEIRSRERKTQELMNRMADTVIKELDKKRDEDEQKVVRYQQEKELRDRMDDDERLRRIKENQKEMRLYLDKQTEEKKKRSLLDKDESKRQAEVWKQEQKVQTEEERTIQQKVLAANKEHAEYLKRQMSDGKKKGKGIMNREEYLMNRKVIEEIETHSKVATPLTHQAQ